MEVTIIPQKGVVLTQKDVSILTQLSDGIPNETIAKKLKISHRTVEGRIGKLLQKFGAKNRTHLIAIAFRSGVIK